MGDVRGHWCVIIDDMISTGGTIDRAVEALLAAGALPEISIVATHGLFVGDGPRQAEPQGDQQCVRHRFGGRRPALADAPDRLDRPLASPRRFAGCCAGTSLSDLHHNVPDAFEPKLRNEQHARE